MTKKELVQSVAQQTGLSQTNVNAVIGATFATIGDAIRKGHRIMVPFFGVFKPVKRAARTAQNPQTGKKINVKAYKTIKFSPAPELRKL